MGVNWERSLLSGRGRDRDEAALTRRDEQGRNKEGTAAAELDFHKGLRPIDQASGQMCPKSRLS